jgi:hypothetical protein
MVDICKPTTTLDGDVHVADTLAPQRIIWPAGTLADSHVKPYAGIQATKREHQRFGRLAIGTTVSVTTQSQVVHEFKVAGTVEKLKVTPITAPVGGDLKYTVDLQVGNASTGFASILSAPLTVDTSSADRTAQDATPTTKATAAGDLVQIVVTASGSTGTQGLGLCAEAKIRETVTT